MNVISDVVIPLISVALSAFISWQIARNLTKKALREQIADGQAVFNSIGYRYFGAIAGSHDHRTARPLDDPQVWIAYRKIMTDILEDIRWLRTNPIFADFPQVSAYFPFLQNSIAAESVGQGVGPSGSTLSLMCKVFIQSGPWEVPIGVPIAADARELAERLCKSIGQ